MKGKKMKLQSRILGLGLTALMTAGLLAAPGMASAQSYRHRSSNTRTENSARNNAIALGAAGLLLLNNDQKLLGTIALGAAVQQTLKMQDSIKERHDREDRYGYNRNGYSASRYGSNHYYNGSYRRGHYQNDDCEKGHDNRYTSYNVSRYGSSHYTNGRYSKGHSKNDDCETGHDHRGQDWAASRGKKKGWDKNGKRR